MTSMRQHAESKARHFFAATHGTVNVRAEERYGTTHREKCLRCEGDCCDPFDSRFKCHRCDGTGVEPR